MFHHKPQLSSNLNGNQRYNQREIRDSLQNANLWKAYLYELQLQAPIPKRVVSTQDINDHLRPRQYGREFHGK